jgi:hypothetical protein
MYCSLSTVLWKNDILSRDHGRSASPRRAHFRTSNFQRIFTFFGISYYLEKTLSFTLFPTSGTDDTRASSQMKIDDNLLFAASVLVSGCEQRPL